MSTASPGARRVGDVMTALSFLGYRCARISVSCKRRDGDSLAGNIIALSSAHGHPHLLVQAGGAYHRLSTTFEHLRGSITPGFAPLVVRYVLRKRWVYVSENDRFADLVDALAALRSAE